MLGLMIPGAIVLVLVILTGLGGLTVLQRMVSAWLRLAGNQEEANRSDKTASSI
jgi:hypothetical protein